MSDSKETKKVDENVNKVEDVDCDDEFEEFAVDDWNKDDTPTEAVWATNWDDDEADQDFVADLRKELGVVA